MIDEREEAILRQFREIDATESMLRETFAPLCVEGHEIGNVCVTAPDEFADGWSVGWFPKYNTADEFRDVPLGRGATLAGAAHELLVHVMWMVRKRAIFRANRAEKLANSGSQW